MFVPPNTTPPHPDMAAQMQAHPPFHTPNQHPSMQFSADVFHYPPSGPTSAPPVPNARFSWDQSPQIGFPSGVMNGQHTFAGNNSVSPGLVWPSNNPSPVHLQGGFQQPVPMAPPQQNIDFWMSSQPSNSGPVGFSQNPSFSSPPSGLNPNILFSFSGAPQTINPSTMNSGHPASDPAGRQPYEHQARESNRERELAKQSRQVRPTAAGSATTLQPRPGLHRSNTDCGPRRNVDRSMESVTAPPAEPILRKASPVKRHSQAGLSSIPEAGRPRLRTRLVVDETGTARTQTEPSSDPDEEVTRSRSFFDDDDSDDDFALPSQRNSFAFPSDLPRAQKHARIDSDPDRFEVSKRPLSSASLASITSRLQVTPIGAKSGDYRRSSMGSFISNDGDNFGSRASTDSPSDAQAALKELVKDRKQRQGIVFARVSSVSFLTLHS